MDFQSLLVNRRSIREFQDKEVSLSVIREILQDTCLAPTASNLQPCRFIVIQNRRFIKRLSDESKKNFLSDLVRDPESPLKKYESYLQDESFNIFYNAPCLVYIVGPKKARSTEIDCTLAAAYFMFSAASKGLGTCWIGLGAQIRDRDILDEMGMPADCRIVAPLIIGYPTVVPATPERHAPDIVKIV